MELWHVCHINPVVFVLYMTTVVPFWIIQYKLSKFKETRKHKNKQ